jgi:hypothetical protein
LARCASCSSRARSLIGRCKKSAGPPTHRLDGYTTVECTHKPATAHRPRGRRPTLLAPSTRPRSRSSGAGGSAGPARMSATTRARMAGSSTWLGRPRRRRLSTASRSTAAESDEGIGPGKHILPSPIRYAFTPSWDGWARADISGHRRAGTACFKRCELLRRFLMVAEAVSKSTEWGVFGPGGVAEGGRWPLAV